MENITVTVEQPKLDVLPSKGMFIDGEYMIDSSGGEYKHVYAATGTITTNVPLAGPKGVEAVVKSARKAFPEWRDMPVSKRQAVLRKLAELIIFNKERLAYLSTIENGMPIKVARKFIDTAAPWFHYYAGYIDKMVGGVDEIYPSQHISYHVREPYGVAVIITAFNAPIVGLCKQISAALAMGNCVVAKPSSSTPFTYSAVAELFIQAGGPPGVFNVIPARGEIGEMLCSHPEVDVIHLTGSTAAGKAVMTAAAKNITPVGLELGGKSPSIIFDDADLEAACKANFIAATHNSGQICSKRSRILVQSGVYEKVIEMTKSLVENVVLGDPLEDTTDMGPVVSESQCNEIMGYIERAKQTKGCRLVLGGERLSGGLESGYFIAPTIFADVDPSMEIFREEVFGPVLTFTRFETEEEAIRLANDSNYGLAGSVFTLDARRMNRVALGMETGSISLNGPGRISHAFPFGGYKESGIGGIGGTAGIDKYTRTKTIVTMLS